MFTGVDSVIVLCRLESADGYPSRNDANEFPFTSLPFVPFEDVMSLSKSNKPVPLPGEKKSSPIFRKSAPAFTVCVPTNFENAALALTDFQLRSVGSIAPSVWLKYWS